VNVKEKKKYIAQNVKNLIIAKKKITFSKQQQDERLNKQQTKI
jgi:hypothetical protein